MFCNYKAVLLFTRGSQSMEKKNEDTSLLLKHLQEGDERAFRTLFEEFYERQNNQAMSGEQREFARRLIEELKEGDPG